MAQPQIPKHRGVIFSVTLCSVRLDPSGVTGIDIMAIATDSISIFNNRKTEFRESPYLLSD